MVERGEDDFLWRVADLAHYLNINEGTVHNWMSQGRITEADGWVRISSRQNRFMVRVVKARVEAGLFGKGLDRNGHPMVRTSRLMVAK